MQNDPRTRSPAHPRSHCLVPAGLLALFAILSIGSMAGKSVTTDEVQYLPVGYTYVQTGDLRLRAGHPPLAMSLAAMPLLTLDLAPAWQSEGWRDGEPWTFGLDFLRANRGLLRPMFFRARSMIVALGIVTGLVLFVWARELWGFWPGAFVLFLYSLSPNMLAHSRLATTDLGAACFTLITIFALWRFCRSGRFVYAAYSGLGLGLGLLTKYSLSLVAIDVVALLALTGLANRVQPERKDQVDPATLLIGFALLALVAAATVHVGFGFPTGLFDYYEAFRHRLGFDRDYTAFLWGEHAHGGFWYYYLLAQLWKTPIPTLVFFSASLWLIDRRGGRGWLDWMFLLLPVATFHIAAASWGVDIGVRHILPVFPFLFLCCGWGASRLADAGTRYRVVFGLLCLWYAAGTLRVYPHFLPYFNELAGGPRGGIDYLGDSNIEWGQDLYALKDLIEAEQPDKLRIAVAGKLQPDDYGISSRPVDLRDVVWPRENVTYFIGAQHLQRSSYFPGMRFHWLERYEPIRRVGWSIYQYRFSTDESRRDDPGVYFIDKQSWYDDAIDDLARIVRLAPSLGQPRHILAEAYHERGTWWRDRGEIEAALPDYVEAVRLQEGSQDFRPDLVSIVSQLRDQATERADRMDCEIGLLFERAGEGPKAMGALFRCLRFDPNHLAARAALAELYDRWRLDGLAKQEWQQCLRIDPEFEPALRRLQRAGRGREAS